LAYRDTTNENREFWKNEMGQALRDIQKVYDDKLDDVRNDVETYYNLKACPASCHSHSFCILFHVMLCYIRQEVLRSREFVGMGGSRKLFWEGHIGLESSKASWGKGLGRGFTPGEPLPQPTRWFGERRGGAVKYDQPEF